MYLTANLHQRLLSQLSSHARRRLSVTRCLRRRSIRICYNVYYVTRIKVPVALHKDFLPYADVCLYISAIPI